LEKDKAKKKRKLTRKSTRKRERDVKSSEKESSDRISYESRQKKQLERDKKTEEWSGRVKVR